MNTENNYVETDLGNISPNPCGEYNQSMQYEYLDLVNYQGGSYLCTVELENKITGIAPVQGKNTEYWQLVTLPGDLTPEYIAMHDDVANKAKQVEASTAAAELAQQEAESALTDVEQLHSDTVNSANKAAESRDSAAGYAQTAETAREKAKESEENVNAQVTDFDTHVAEKTQEVEQAIADARQQAVQTVAKQGELSVQAVKDETAEYIEEQKNTAKEEINSRADEKIEEINQAYKPLDEKVELLNEDVDTLKNDTKELNDKKITKFYASSQGGTHLADSDNGKIMDMMLYGKSEQFTATGKNLLKIRDGAQTTRGVTVTAKDGVFGLKGTATETGWAIFDVDSFVLDRTCILSSNISTGIKAVVANKSFKPVLEQNKSVTLENAEVSKVCFLIEEGKTYGISNILVQIEKGSVVTSYEPYTGGIPSPNPDYPQEIKSVVNPVVKICGKNLLKSVLKTQTKDGVSCKNNSDGTYTFNGTITTDGKEYVDFNFVGDYYASKPINNGGAFVGTIGLENAIDGILIFAVNNTRVLASGNNLIKGKGSVACFMIRIKKGVVLDNLVIKPMIVAGDLDDNYFEEYKEQVAIFPYTLNAIPVTKDGNYTDENGQQYIADFVDIERKKLVRVVKKGFLQQINWGNTSYKGVFRFYNTTSAALNIKQNLVSKDNISMSSHFNFTNTLPDTVGQYTANTTGVFSNIGFAFTTDAKMTSDDFNEWISKNNPFVLFKLSEQEEIDLTDEELEAFKKLETYYPVTNILTTSDELDGYTTFNYPVSLENGWNYVKQQLSDSRDYIYNIDNRAQEIDMQSAEAYVNSEYAVALTELEVM